MIQRIQSLFLLGVGVCMILMTIFPLWQKFSIENAEIVHVNAFTLTYAALGDVATLERSDVKSEVSVFYIAVLAFSAAVTAFYSIFKYNNRLLQMKLGLLNSLLMAATLVTTMYVIFYMADPLLEAELPGQFLVGIAFPMAAMFLNILANRFIRRDEKLVRSVDRLR